MMLKAFIAAAFVVAVVTPSFAFEQITPGRIGPRTPGVGGEAAPLGGAARPVVAAAAAAATAAAVEAAVVPLPKPDLRKPLPGTDPIKPAANAADPIKPLAESDPTKPAVIVVEQMTPTAPVPYTWGPFISAYGEALGLDPNLLPKVDTAQAPANNEAIDTAKTLASEAIDEAAAQSALIDPWTLKPQGPSANPAAAGFEPHGPFMVSKPKPSVEVVELPHDRSAVE